MTLGTMQGVMGGSDADVFDRARQFGLKGIEPDLTLDDLKSASSARLQRLRELSNSTGLAIPSICLGVHNNHGFIAAPDRSDTVVSEVRIAIDWAAALGARVILLPFFFKNDPKGDVTKLARTAQILKPLCAEAAARGIALCYEGTLPAEDLHEMATRIDSPAGFGVYFDLANVYWAGMNGPEQIRKQGPLIRQVHMKETKVGPGDVRPGLGRVDYAASAMALREIGYDGWLILETPTGDDAAIGEDIAFTKRFFT
jgi:L-ribulose-5-phosphate 3-epimerase